VCAVLFLSACTQPSSGGADVRTPFDPDLYGWKTASWIPFDVADTLSGFAYGVYRGADRFVAVAKTGVIGWSDNGDIWFPAVKAPDSDPDNPAPDPFEASFNAVAWGNGIFVAVADGGKIARSDDGVNWTAVGYSGGIDGFGAENITGVAWGSGVFVAVGGNANISYSADGISWIPCRDANFGASQLNDIAFDNAGGRFYIVGDDGKRGWSDITLMKQANWNLLELSDASTAPFGKNSLRKVTVGRCGGGIGIGVVFDEWGGNRIFVAKDANFGDLDAGIDPGNFNGNAINAIAWGGDVFVAAGTGAMIGWWPDNEPSPDSQRYWRALSFPEFQWWEISALAALKDRFFVGNVGGKIGYSK